MARLGMDYVRPEDLSFSPEEEARIASIRNHRYEASARMNRLLPYVERLPFFLFWRPKQATTSNVVNYRYEGQAPNREMFAWLQRAPGAKQVGLYLQEEEDVGRDKLMVVERPKLMVVAADGDVSYGSKYSPAFYEQHFRMQWQEMAINNVLQTLRLFNQPPASGEQPR